MAKLPKRKLELASSSTRYALIHSSTYPAPSFERWIQLTDAYAKQFFLMGRGDKNARQEALRLARELQRMNRSIGAAI